MKLPNRKIIAALGAVMLSVGFSAGAAELEGRIQSVDLHSSSIFVNGAQIFITGQTRLESMFYNFNHLTPGMRVEIDYMQSNGKLIATEIELDD